MNKRTRWWLVTCAALVGCTVTSCLGVWQLSRAAQKDAIGQMVARRAAGPEMDAAALLSAPDPAALHYRRAALHGQWLTDKTVFLDNRQMQGRVGFYVVTPLQLSSGVGILVWRGWTPRNFLDRMALPAVPTPKGEVVVHGFIAPEPGKLYEPGHTQMGAIRQNVPIATFATETRLPLLSVVLMQSGEVPDGLLRVWPPVQLGLEKHYGYAAQWFALAVLIAALWVWFQLLKPALGRKKESSPHVQ